MPFDAFVESLEGLDESVQENYKEVDGGFAFQLNPVTHTMEVDGKDKNFLYAAQEINGLTTSLSKERVANKTNNTTIKAFEKKYGEVDLDALNGFQEKYNTANEALTELTGKYDTLVAFDPEKEADARAETKSKATVKRKLKEYQDQRDVEVATSTETITGLQNTNKVLESQLKNELMIGKATEALVAAGVDKSLELMLPPLLSQLTSEITETGYATTVVDSEGLPRVKLDGTDMGVVDLVGELMVKYPDHFKISAKPGGGKPAEGGGGQPQQKDLSADENISAGLAARKAQ